VREDAPLKERWLGGHPAQGRPKPLLAKSA